MQDMTPLLKTTITATAVAPFVGMSKSAVYGAIRDNKFPFPVLRIGGRIVIPTAPIRAALGLVSTEQGVA